MSHLIAVLIGLTCSLGSVISVVSVVNYGITWFVAFNLFIVFLLGLDLFFHRKQRVMSQREAWLWSALWIVLALLFCLFIYFALGKEPALNYLSGYLIEKSLSIDNLFVFYLIFTYFAVPQKFLHKVLFWGVIGALLMRAIFIFSGVVLIRHLHWVIYIFGAFLIYTGIKFLFVTDEKVKPGENFVLKIFRKLIPMTQDYVGDRFFVKIESKYWATPLFATLICIETSDIIFAIDSVPAILAITTDPFIVYTSNVFAVLGLRALYFALSGMIQAFRYLHYGLAALLVFIGIKMMLSDYVQIPITMVLGVIVGILALSAIASVIDPWQRSR